MEINWFGLVIGILITCLSYMLIPVILKLKNGGYDESKAKKIALWNSIIVGGIYMILTIELMGTSSAWNAGPAFLYYGINFSLLKRGKKAIKEKVKKEKVKKEKVETPEGHNSIWKVILIVAGAVIAIFVALAIIGNLSNESEDKRLRARHILVEDYKTAKAVIALLESGEDFCDLAFDYSEDTATANDCGDIGYFKEGEMVIEFEEAVKNLKYNKYTELPVRTDYGYHIIMRIK